MRLQSRGACRQHHWGLPSCVGAGQLQLLPGQQDLLLERSEAESPACTSSHGTPAAPLVWRAAAPRCMCPFHTLALALPMLLALLPQQLGGFEDRCPHRLAPLSEGRLEPSTGHLMCSYHGWQFDAQGTCTSIPQIGEPAAHAAACSSKRTCAIAYPSQVAQGLLWVWPDAASAELAAASPPALSSQYGAEGWTLLGGEWFARDLEYGFDTMMENLFDPSHIPFAHHGIMGTASRDKAQPLYITTQVDVTPTGGFKLVRDSAPFKTAAPTDTVNSFVPPVLNASSQTNTAKGTTLVLTFYGIPTAPGKSRVITAFFTSAKVPAFAAKLASAVEWVFHLGQNQVLDSDAMLLHVQERLLHEGRNPNWRSAFYMPAGSDLGIIKFRSWYHDCAGGSIPWPGSLAQQPLGPVKPRQVVMDRFAQHTAHCKSCSAAVKWIQRLQAVCLGLSGIAAAGCTAAVTAAAVAASGTAGMLSPPSPAAAAAAAAAPNAGLVQAAAGALAALPAWQCALMGLLAAAFLFAHWQLGQLKQRFFFIDYEHWNRQ
ncbi:hypothetical protein COO60DRAFT_1074951 [Scenedesmus sp. NREL 46B-D3]|nr:hypothetical protein COO60DRAFT_1074951 [Scenedesmus sp. NREL 46B-D3]